MTIEEVGNKHNEVLAKLGKRGELLRGLLFSTAMRIMELQLTDSEVRLFANMIVEASQVADEE
jgi:hypothetical protein